MSTADELNQLNLRYRHVFVIVRLDHYDDREAKLDPNHVTVTKVFVSEVDADREADRLNSLNADKGAEYHVRFGRLVE